VRNFLTKVQWKWVFINTAVLMILALLVPLVHYATFVSTEVAGVGFDMLIYEPFSGAPSVIAFFVFLLMNLKWAHKGKGLIFAAVILALLFTAIWFALSFFLLVETHWALGGHL